MTHKFVRVLSLITILTSILFQTIGTGAAHEYWIQPLDFTPALEAEFSADLIVGGDLKGDKLAFIPQFAVRYDVVDAQGMFAPEGAAGDRPALNFAPRSEGLNTIIYQSKGNRLEYKDPETLPTYTEQEGFVGLLERHTERGLDLTGFSERYSRFAKSLIDVGGTGTGMDAPVGLQIELVALTNPYVLSEGDMMEVQLLWEGEPLADVQVKIFVRGLEVQQDVEPKLDIMTQRSDAIGMVSFPLVAEGLYLLNAVRIEERDIAETGLAWESFWASLTFATE